MGNRPRGLQRRRQRLGLLRHDQARSRAYRWSEDGLAGISDDHGRLCLSLALWNEADPILKERLFGVTNSEGNHGEDVKEQYFYLDATPTRAWLGYLYNYEYFHGDSGAGLGASHQTGWSGVVARLIQPFGHLDPADVLGRGGRPVTRPYVREVAEDDEVLAG